MKFLTGAHKRFVFVVHLIIYPFRPMFLRAIFLRKVKVRVFLKGGSHMDILCEKWTITINEGNHSYHFDGLYHEVLIDPAEIVAVQAR